MTLTAGSHIAPHLRLVRPLGKGGMGSVWIVYHGMLDAEVAVKFIAHELSDLDEMVVARFKREAALSARLKSPHVVKTFDHGKMDDGRPYIVMELLEGETLGERMQRVGRLPPRDVALIVTQVAQVLREAHGLGVVHRDIKPDNIFMLSSAYDLFVKVLDFGIAKQTSMPPHATVTDTGAIIGTPEYMSPEQLLSTGQADFRADMWALAVLAYHALTGRAPFVGETLPALSLKICGGRFDPPSKHEPSLPHALDAWFERAFAPEQDERFADVARLADSFRRVIAGEEDFGIAPVTPTPLPPISSSARPDESGSVPRVSAERAGETLMSVLDDSSPRPPGPSPDDSGVQPAVRIASADQSGRRQAISDTLMAGHTPTFSGASSNLRRAESASRRSPLLWVAAALLLLLFAGIIASFQGPGHITRAPAASAVAPDPGLPSASAPRPLAPVPSSRRSAPSAMPAQPSATTSATASVRSPAPAATVSVGPRRGSALPGTPSLPPSSLPSASPPEHICDNPYIANLDGTLTVRPECLR